MQEITVGSLFDGIGGFPYAASFYDIRPLWASEIMPSCVSVTQKHFPDMAHVGDVTQLNGAKLPPVDIITFGSPCQGLSLAGRRRGLADERSGLFLEAIRIIFEMREATHGKYPRFALFENVPGALSSAGGRDYQIVLQSFTKAEIPVPRSGKWADAGMVRGRGVDLAWCVYDAQHFGTAQRRRRLFLVADFGGKRADEILFVPKSLRGYFEAGGTPRQGLTAFAEDGAGAAGPEIDILNDHGGKSITVGRSGLSPTLRCQSKGNLPIVAADVSVPVGINGNLAGTLDASYYKGTGMRCGVERDVVLCMATGQFHAEILDNMSPTLNCNCEQPILVHPQLSGTLCASGAGLSRPAGMGSELDFCVLKAYSIGAYYSKGMLSANPSAGIREADTSRTLDLNGGNPACQQGGIAIVSAVDCRNLREIGEISGTLQAKSASAGYSLNYQNPVRIGFNIRRLTPIEAERLMGFPDFWTESGMDGKPISDSARYQMLGNSVVTPCVAYIHAGHPGGDGVKIGLVDVDSHNFPNLCLMKLSAYHKAKGDTVEWWHPAGWYDVVYKSRVFTDTYSKDNIDIGNAGTVIKGGTGYGPGPDLPDVVEHQRPDYSIYPQFSGTAYGFLTRGCPRQCGFCIVSGKEGRQSRQVADLSEFWGGEKEIKLLDANLLACPDHERLLVQLAESRALVDFSQGLDIRLTTPDNIALLNRVRTKAVHFAWDDPNTDLTTYFRRFVEQSAVTNFRKRKVYVLTNYGSTHEQDLYRIYTLRELGYDPFVMIYERPTAPKITRQLQRWVNNKWVFRTVDSFDDYIRSTVKKEA